MLGALGLDGEAEAVYRLMLQQPAWGITRLAAELARDERAVAAALDRLADLALLRPSWTEAGVMRPVSPQLALEALLARRQAEVARQQQAIEESRAAVAGLLADYAQHRPEHEHGTEHLEDMDAIRRRLEELAHGARFETLSLAPGGPQTAENRAASRPLSEAMLARGVRIRTLYLDSVTNDAGSREHARWLAGLGGETRTVPSLPMRMQVVDREVAMVPLDPADSSRGAALIREPGAIAGFCALFDQLWASGVPLGEAPVVHEEEHVTPQERELLRLLAQGLTDEAAARKLGVSLRTERRMITELSQRLDAASRFQLGRRASELGLL
ncbi:LuxR C-terminal-related transcriptional regulator [Kitasatospora sp. NPDC051853]|uniref:LuxR C-terminal-related transcriptional regulator n=1 Tax=Kitasatospora sp. NPDC051853 TaxID=3364058 RepID=UPI00379772B2